MEKCAKVFGNALQISMENRRSHHPGAVKSENARNALKVFPSPCDELFSRADKFATANADHD